MSSSKIVILYRNTLFFNKSQTNGICCAIIISAQPAVTSMKGAFVVMLDNTNEEGYIDERALTDLEKTILHDFQLLSEDEQKSIFDFISSLLGR